MIFFRRFLFLSLCVILGSPTLSRTAQAYSPPTAAFVLDVNADRVLYAQNADSIRHPASLTKVMTIFLLLEEVEAGRKSMNSRLRVSRNAAAQPALKLGLREGQTIRVEDAILALSVRSSNDVATVVAEAVSGSESAFVTRMNRTARRIGMTQTRFTNPHGLPDQRQVTTARDLARLAVATMDRFSQYAHFFAQRSFRYGSRTLTSTNRLLSVPGVNGMKTGFIRASGFNLMTTYARDGRRLVVIVLGGRSGAQRDARVRQLITTHLPAASRQVVSTRLTQQSRIPLPPRRPN